MAANTDLPTEEEIDQMKLGKLTRLLREFGMTEDETDEMEKEEAREELKKKIRDKQAAAATRRRPGQVSNVQQTSEPLHVDVTTAEKTDLDLPTEEEVDKMKPFESFLALQKYGMTDSELGKLNEKDAKAELKRRLRDIQATAATRRRPGQITKMLQRAMSENKTKREGLKAICDSIWDFLEDMDDDDKQKITDIFGQEFQVVLEDVRTFLQNNDCPILVVGESSAGKSSLLNLLLGDNILPVSPRASTSTLCFVRYGEKKRATVTLKDPTAGTRKHMIDLQDMDRDRAKKELAFYVHRWGKENAGEVEKVEIEWPLEFLQGGICLVDGPGIKAKKKMDEVVAGAVSSTFAFIYVINSANAPLPAPGCSGDGEGVDEHTDGLSILLELWKEWENTSQLELESTMFICNRWDCVPEHHENQEVKNDYLMLLRSHFPQLRDDQVFFLSCIKAVGPAGLLSPEFTRLLEGLDALLPQSLQHKLERQYQKLKGQHVVKCFGTYRGETDAQGTPCLGLVMEYCPKTLYTEMFEKRENSPAWWGSDPEKQAAAFSYTKGKALQLLEGLKHIHDARYMHRDLKLINVLVSSEGVVKLADLGSTKSEKAYARSNQGTRYYTAPEVLAHKKYDRSADMYSMGVILLEMWYGRTIYVPEDPVYESQFDEAVPLNLGQELPLPSWPGRAPPIPEWRKLINECLRRSPDKRPTAENCRDRIAGMSLPPAQTNSEPRATSEVRIDME